jgi:hypothetical protein
VIDPTSRYAALSQAPLTWTDSLGREIRYVPRRFLAPIQVFELLAEVVVQGGDRLDLIATRTLGAPDAWWRIADANETLDPAALTPDPADVWRSTAEASSAPDPASVVSQPATRLRVPVPRA